MMFAHTEYHKSYFPLPYLNSKKYEFLAYVFCEQELEGHIKEKLSFMLFTA